MDTQIIETEYPLSFRAEDAKLLGEYLCHRQSVDLVGMKRVGISNFLRFFLYHANISATYIDPSQKHLFIPVDLNDLVERELYPFWTLTFKRMVDEVEKTDLPDVVQQKISSSFLSAIQSHDLFLLIDGIRRALALLVEEGYLPTLFFLRFDRIKNAVTPEFFDNLQGLRDAAHEKLAFVFTSYRSLDVLSPEVLTRASLSTFSQIMYLKPLSLTDIRVIYAYYHDRYELSLSQELQQELFRLIGGDVQYLQIALIVLREKKEHSIVTKEELFDILVQDERMMLQSEELWESLTPDEKEVLLRIVKGDVISQTEQKSVPYIFETGMVQGKANFEVFSPLYSHYVSRQSLSSTRSRELVFSKKEHLLFTTLKDHLGEIMEREEIIEAVWPEYREFGVSDWSIDRLVARVRAKLRQQESPYEIKTVRTRGYLLISKA